MCQYSQQQTQIANIKLCTPTERLLTFALSTASTRWWEIFVESVLNDTIETLQHQHQRSALLTVQILRHRPLRRSVNLDRFSSNSAPCHVHSRHSIWESTDFYRIQDVYQAAARSSNLFGTILFEKSNMRCAHSSLQSNRRVVIRPGNYTRLASVVD